ncbi:MAG: GPW/gp25 family protein [Candidatus Dojkabacteria bacterium]|nr:GPW/gp25 family protein [Candidatus Dojkabacteria bacterium]
MTCSLVENDVIKSIIQNIKIILNTPKGSDIHRPDFGSDLWLLLDQPITSIIEGQIYSEIYQSLQDFEPRANILSISLIKNSINTKISIQLQIKDTSEVINIWI